MSKDPSPYFREAAEALQRGDLSRARAIAEERVESEQSPQWNHLLGILDCREGRVEEGVEHLRSAAQAEPRNATFQVMLARALVDAGRADEVLAMPEPPPPSSPATLALWQARAEAADAAGKAEAAVDAWFKITGATPSDWRAWGNYGKALQAVKQWDKAAEALCEAARLNPAEPAIREDAVAALIAAGREHHALLRFDQAEAAFRRAHELDPANATIVHHLGIALERTNCLDALATLLDTADAAIPRARLRYLDALLAWRRRDVERAWELLGETDPGDDPVAWNALRSKVADALGDSEAAFAAASAMNRAAIDRVVGPEAREEWDQSAEQYREEQRRLAQAITPEWAARVPVLREPSPRRVAFLVGFPRSGTTLLDTFLLGHSNIAVLEEKQLVGRAGETVGPIIQLPSVPLGKIEEARAAYLRMLAEEVGRGFDGLTIDKFPLDMGSTPLIQAMFSGAPIIFAQRHPCDVVLSGFLQPFGMVNFSDIRDAADYYAAMMSIWFASLESLPLNVHTVVYEELVRDPEAALRPAVGFLGLQWEDAILDHQRTARGRGTIQTPSYDQVTEPVTTRASGRWKRYASQLEPVLPILLPWAERLGYAD